MEYIQGLAVATGIAIGMIEINRSIQVETSVVKIEDVESEIKRYDAARQKSIAELEGIYEKALRQLGEDEASIFEAHIVLLQDEEYISLVASVIEEQQVNAEYAVNYVCRQWVQKFEAMEDEYFQARSADMKDISKRVVKALEGEKSDTKDNKNIIVMASELTPSEIMELGRERLVGIVTEKGSANAHVAIIARAMGVPDIVNVAPKEEWDGKYGIVNGYTGEVWIEPDENTLNRLRKLQAEYQRQENKEREQLMSQYTGKETVTSDGRKIRLYANIGQAEDINEALDNDAEGIGLYRTEFLYLYRDTYPTEEEQFEAYKSVVSGMSGRKVIIRTADIGADKQAEYMNMEKEENPALGYRGIRVCLDRMDMFKTQLRAILRVSAYGDVGIMFPMITSVDEVREAKSILERVREELGSEQVPCGSVDVGIMIETPAAVMICDILADEVDFFSIGTNDLIQYTLGADRQNPKLKKIYDGHHMAIMRMIDMVVKNAHKKGVWVGICGELAADTTLTKTFIDMCIDELSVESSKVLKLRKTIFEL